jgi:quinol monooxygenase YgiN
MIIVKAIITAKPGDRDKIISISQDVIGPTCSELGCVSYELFASTQDKDVLVMFEQWENREVLETHMQTEHFKAFGVAIKDLIAKELEISVYSAEKA